jgi:hypothetical protein
MLYSYSVILLVSVFIAMLFMIPVYYAIATLRTFDPNKRKSWKKASGKANLSADEFIKRVQKLCLHRRYVLLEISPTHAYLKENISFSSGGVMYYIELNATEPDTITVWARGCIYKNRINPNCLISMVNLFYS